MIEIRNPQWLTKTGACLVFALLCWGTFLMHNQANPERSGIKHLANEYRSFITGLRTLLPPPQSETIFFDSHPRYFDERLLLSATQVAFRRTDLRVKLVSEFPSQARYRLRFHDSRLVQILQ